MAEKDGEPTTDDELWAAQLLVMWLQLDQIHIPMPVDTLHNEVRQDLLAAQQALANARRRLLGHD